jgi:ABC-type glycerol-3-phosphate transport system substrate-binding protein
MVIFSGDKFKKLAGWEFIRHMMEEKNQTDFALAAGYLPVRKSSLKNP